MLPGSVSRMAGGLFTSVRRLSEALDDIESIQVDVIGNQDCHTEADIHTWREPPSLIQSSSFYSRAREVVRELGKKNTEIVHPQFLWSYGSLASYLWKTGHPDRRVVISPRGMLDPWAVKNSYFKKKVIASLFENRHFRLASCFHALCESEAKSIRSYGLSNPVFVIPNGVDLPDLDGIVERRKAKKSSASGRRVMLFIGRIHPKKGLENLLRAWKRLGPKLDGWELRLAGWDDGGHLQYLQKVTTELNLDQSVTWVGSVLGEDKSQELIDADAFILPSFSEGLPMAILEAWSYSLPVVMTPQCNLPIGFSKNAAIKVTTDATSLAEGLSGMVELSDQERERMGQVGRELASTRFGWSQIAAQMNEVYRWTLEGGVLPASAYC